jgi:hypothetical protein
VLVTSRIVFSVAMDWSILRKIGMDLSGRTILRWFLRMRVLSWSSRSMN